MIPRRTLLLAAFLPVVVGCGGSGEAEKADGVPPRAGWVTYTTPDGFVTIDFPKEPVVEPIEDLSLEEPNTDGGVVALSSGHGLRFTATCGALDGDEEGESIGFGFGELEFLGDSLVDVMLRSQNARLLEESDVTINGVTGRQLYSKVQYGPFVRAFVLNRPVFVWLQVEGNTRADVDGPEAEAFFESVRFAR